MKNQRIFILVSVGLLLASGLWASEFKEWLKLSSGEHYQQTEQKMVDSKGDAFLIRKLDQVPMKLVHALVKSSYPQAEVNKERELLKIEAEQEAQKDPAYKVGRTHPVHVDRLINKIREIMRSRPDIVPVLGKEHEWSPEAHHYLLFGFWKRLGSFIIGKQKEFPSPLFMRSKLFLLLACGWTSRYAITGKEAELEAKIMSYPDRSVQIHDLFRESYVMNKGNLYLTLLTAENVLAGDPYRANRGDSSLQKKLLYIRNDPAPMGDNYGAWYHFFGIGLYGLIRSPVVARAVAEIESFGSLFLEGPDKQEDFINRLGAIWGRKLEKMLKNRTYLQPLSHDDRTDYLLNVSK